MVEPALHRLEEAGRVDPPLCSGVLAVALVNRKDRRHFMRVVVDGHGNVRPAGVQTRHPLSPLALANGLVDVPPNTTLPVGTRTPVIPWV